MRQLTLTTLLVHQNKSVVVVPGMLLPPVGSYVKIPEYIPGTDAKRDVLWAYDHDELLKDEQGDVVAVTRFFREAL